jgi:hypothetical protein
LITYGKEKNELLKQNRGIGFEEIISAIDSGKVLDLYDHPDQVNYPGLYARIQFGHPAHLHLAS